MLSDGKGREQKKNQRSLFIFHVDRLLAESISSEKLSMSVN